MYVVIHGYDPAKAGAIQEACNGEWDFGDDWYCMKGDGGEDHGEEMSATGQGNLCAGESEDAFARRVRDAIWTANGKFCDIEVCCTYMENLPHEDYAFDEDDYSRWQEEKAKVQ
jgi:hypothetical protein